MMPSIWSRRRMLGVGAATAVTLPLLPRPALAAAVPGQVVTLPAPIRVFDSRLPAAPLNGNKLAAGSAVAVTVSPAYAPDLASSVFANVTITDTEGAGFLTVAADDLSGEQPVPATSNINWWMAGMTLANLILVPVGGEHAIAVHCRGTGRTHIVVDIQGYVPAPN